MALARYRVWVETGPEDKDYCYANDMDRVVDYLLSDDLSDVPCGIEKFDGTQSIFVDSFCTDDLKALYDAVLTRVRKDMDRLSESLAAIHESVVPK